MSSVSGGPGKALDNAPKTAYVIDLIVLLQQMFLVATRRLYGKQREEARPEDRGTLDYFGDWVFNRALYADGHPKFQGVTFYGIYASE